MSQPSPSATVDNLHEGWLATADPPHVSGRIGGPEGFVRRDEPKGVVACLKTSGSQPHERKGILPAARPSLARA